MNTFNMGMKEYILAALTVLLSATGCQTYRDIEPLDKTMGHFLISKCRKYTHWEKENGFMVEGPFERELAGGKTEFYEGRIEYVQNHAEHGPVVRLTTTYKGFVVQGYDGWKENRLDGEFDHLETPFGTFETPDGKSIQDQHGFKAKDIAETKKNFQEQYPKIKELIKKKFGEFAEIPDEPVAEHLTEEK